MLFLLWTRYESIVVEKNSADSGASCAGPVAQNNVDSTFFCLCGTRMESRSYAFVREPQLQLWHVPLLFPPPVTVARFTDLREDEGWGRAWQQKGLVEDFKTKPEDEINQHTKMESEFVLIKNVDIWEKQIRGRRNNDECSHSSMISEKQTKSMTVSSDNKS